MDRRGFFGSLFLFGAAPMMMGAEAVKEAVTPATDEVVINGNVKVNGTLTVTTPSNESKAAFKVTRLKEETPNTTSTSNITFNPYFSSTFVID